MQIMSLKSFTSCGCIVHLYSYDDINVDINNVVLIDAQKILPKSAMYKYEDGSISAFSNTFRFSLLYQKGGIWSDLDVICIKRVDIEKPIAISSEARPDGSRIPTTHFLKMPKNSLVAHKCLKLTETYKTKVVNGVVKWGVGPKVINAIVTELNLASCLLDPEETSLCGPLNYKMLFTHASVTIPERTFVVHMWQEMWRKDTIVEEESSFFSKIKHIYSKF